MISNHFKHVSFPGLHINRKDHKHMFANTFYKAITVCLGLRIPLLIAGMHISLEIFGIPKTLKISFTEHDRKHVMQLFRLYGDHALDHKHMLANMFPDMALLLRRSPKYWECKILQASSSSFPVNKSNLHEKRIILVLQRFDWSSWIVQTSILLHNLTI